MLKELCLYTTNVCNSSCKYCNIGKSQNKYINLDFNWLKNRVFPFLRQSNTLVVLGNETTMWKHFDEFGEYVNSGNMDSIKYLLLSNCVNYDKLLKYRFKQFTVSWDGITSDNTRYAGCTENVMSFIKQLRKGQIARIAYVLNEENFYNIISDFEKINKLRVQTDAELLNPYLLINTNIPYFMIGEEQNNYGMTWLFNKLANSHVKQYFNDVLAWLNNNNYIQQYTFNALDSMVNSADGLNNIACTNPYYSLQIDEYGKLRFCPGTYWKTILNNNVYNYNIIQLEKMYKDKLYRSIFCDKIGTCGVGCRFHIDAKEKLNGIKL